MDDVGYRAVAISTAIAGLAFLALFRAQEEKYGVSLLLAGATYLLIALFPDELALYPFPLSWVWVYAAGIMSAIVVAGCCIVLDLFRLIARIPLRIW